MNTQLQVHIPIVYHLHLGDTLLHSWDLELILFMLGNEEIDLVLQLVLVVMAPRGDTLPGSISHNIVGRCSKR
jgi:hypothetical protein